MMHLRTIFTKGLTKNAYRSPLNSVYKSHSYRFSNFFKFSKDPSLVKVHAMNTLSRAATAAIVIGVAAYYLHPLFEDKQLKCFAEGFYPVMTPHEIDTYIQRDKEKDLLKLHLESPEIVTLISGEKGVGKTTFIQNFCEERKTGIVYVSGNKNQDRFLQEFSQAVGFSNGEMKVSTVREVLNWATGKTETISFAQLGMRLEMLADEYLRQPNITTPPVLVIDDLDAIYDGDLGKADDQKLVTELQKFAYNCSKTKSLKVIFVGNLRGSADKLLKKNRDEMGILQHEIIMPPFENKQALEFLERRFKLPTNIAQMMIKRYGTKATNLVLVGFYYKIWQHYLPTAKPEDVFKALVKQLPKINLPEKQSIEDRIETLGSYTLIGILFTLGFYYFT
jgi:hypothetical protein